MNFQLGEAERSLQGMASGFLHRLPYIGLALLVYLLFHFTARGVRALLARVANRRSTHYAAGQVLGRLAQAAIIALGVLIALVIVIPSFQLGQVVQLLGISSVAVGFAFRDVLQNFLAGLLILFNQPFRLGDQIVVGNFEGTVESIETRATFIRTYDGRRVVIPNSTLFNQSVTVNTAYGTRRLEYELHLDEIDDLERVKATVLDALRTTPSVMDDPPPDVLATDVSAKGATLRARWWVRPPHRADINTSRDEALAAIRRKLPQVSESPAQSPA